jgi:hypothetical protein
MNRLSRLTQLTGLLFAALNIRGRHGGPDAAQRAGERGKRDRVLSGSAYSFALAFGLPLVTPISSIRPGGISRRWIRVCSVSLSPLRSGRVRGLERCWA